MVGSSSRVKTYFFMVQYHENIVRENMIGSGVESKGHRNRQNLFRIPIVYEVRVKPPIFNLVYYLVYSVE